MTPCEGEDVIACRKIGTAATRPEPAQRPVCPVCGATADLRFGLGPYSDFGCPACDNRFSPDAIRDHHLGSVYSDDNFFSGGDGYQDYLVEADLLRAQFQ